jgi:pyruvate dehydrogenase (quinone)/pyruvate oxidase
MIKWEQLVFLSNPQYGVELEPIDHVKFAEACGGRGFRIDDPGPCAEIIQRAFATPGPVIVEAVVDPNEPPLPPKIMPEQAMHFAEALVRGEPNREKLALTVMSETVRQVV